MPVITDDEDRTPVVSPVAVAADDEDQDMILSPLPVKRNSEDRTPVVSPVMMLEDDAEPTSDASAAEDGDRTPVMSPAFVAEDMEESTPPVTTRCDRKESDPNTSDSILGPTPKPTAKPKSSCGASYVGVRRPATPDLFSDSLHSTNQTPSPTAATSVHEDEDEIPPSPEVITFLLKIVIKNFHYLNYFHRW